METCFVALSAFAVFIAAGVRGCYHAREKAADRQELAARTPLYPVLLHRARLHDGHAIVGHLGSTAERLESGSDELNLARVWRSSDVLDHLDRRVVVAVAPGYRLGAGIGTSWQGLFCLPRSDVASRSGHLDDPRNDSSGTSLIAKRRYGDSSRAGN